MSTTLSAGTATTGAALASDTSGVLQLQSGSTPTTAVTINTSQAVGIGTTSPASPSGFAQNVTLYNATNAAYVVNANNAYRCEFAVSSSGGWLSTYDSIPLRFATSNTEVGRFDTSGNLLVGTTSFAYTSAGVQIKNQINIGSSGTGGTTLMNFGNANGAVGSITVGGTSTSFNTSSDRRLKTNIVDLTNSGTVIDSLKPRAFTWISDNSADAGFIADEFQQVLPKAVVGQPNAVDAEGKPVYQMIDASQPELIAYLVAEIQSLRIRTASLEAEVTALKGAK
jgi:Chaperone of endosialidase